MLQVDEHEAGQSRTPSSIAMAVGPLALHKVTT